MSSLEDSSRIDHCPDRHENKRSSRNNKETSAPLVRCSDWTYCDIEVEKISWMFEKL